MTLAEAYNEIMRRKPEVAGEPLYVDHQSYLSIYDELAAMKISKKRGVLAADSGFSNYLVAGVEVRPYG